MTDERLGASMLEADRCAFRVWAPKAQRVEVRLLGSPNRIVALRPSTNGYHEAIVGQVRPGNRYRFRFNDIERPDPASRWQPEGVHGPSAVADLDTFAWDDAGWKGRRWPSTSSMSCTSARSAPRARSRGSSRTSTSCRAWASPQSS